MLAPCGNWKRFLRTMHFLIASHCFRLRDPSARINTRNRVDPAMDEIATRMLFNFRVKELTLLAFNFYPSSPYIVTLERDSVPVVEAFTILCRRMKEPSTLFTVAKGFGRPPVAYSSIRDQVVNELYDKR
ncbi:hypothetical protein JG688_00014249 [Phytophthora aleatoria]|uniref:Uncharacterized protein n=1 Tax=Phytophthora aleatoria TaxID=2496075 RepID=A0A8J5M3E8_9STRA|nr:hypothetical protein JG688_00014249 [Phytophthora aleatoria]